MKKERIFAIITSLLLIALASIIIINQTNLTGRAITGNVVLENINDISNFDNWEYRTMPELFDSPSSNTGENKELSITSTDDGCGTNPEINNCDFGFWTTHPNRVSLKKDKLYKISFFISSDKSADELSKVPNFRLRINEYKERISLFLIVNSFPDKNFNFAPGIMPKKYYVYFSPPIDSEYYLNFDLINFADDINSKLTLHNLEITEIDSDDFAEQDIGFIFNTDNWQPATMPEFFSEPRLTKNEQENILKIESTNNEDNFGYWTSAPNYIDYELNSLYKITFKISSDGILSEKIPRIRLRLNTIEEQISYVYSISSFNDASLSPSFIEKEYGFYFLIPHTSNNPQNKKFYLNLDLVNFDNSDYSNTEFTLHDITISKIIDPIIEDSEQQGCSEESDGLRNGFNINIQQTHEICQVDTGCVNIREKCKNSKELYEISISEYNMPVINVVECDYKCENGACISY